MSGSTSATMAMEQTDLHTVRVFRYAVGSTIAMAVAMGVAWPLSFIAPILALPFLASPGPRLSLRAGIGFVSAVFVACLAGLLLSRFLVPYSMVFLPFMFVLLLLIYHAKAGGASPLLTTWLLIAFLLLPLMEMQASVVPVVIISGLVFGAIAAVGFTWLAHGLFPDPPGAHQGATKAKQTAPPLSPEDRFHAAMIPAVAVFPVVVVFFIFNLSGAMLILLFIALLSSQQGFAGNFKAGLMLVLGNAIGGFAAIVIFELLVMVPEYFFFVLLFLLAGFVFGAQVFSGKPSAALFKTGYSTTLLVIGMSTSGEGEAGGTVYSRVFSIMLAVAYVSLVCGVLQQWFNRRRAK